MVAKWHTVATAQPKGHNCVRGDIYAHSGTCTRERTGSVLHESGVSRDQAFRFR